jgi:hypothetical protein
MNSVIKQKKIAPEDAPSSQGVCVFKAELYHALPIPKLQSNNIGLSLPREQLKSEAAHQKNVPYEVARIR